MPDNAIGNGTKSVRSILIQFVKIIVRHRLAIKPFSKIKFLKLYRANNYLLELKFEIVLAFLVSKYLS